MNFSPYVNADGLSGNAQVIPQGPVAALEFIKNLGTNGGGFFNANGAHPYENPTPGANFIEMLAILILPASFTCTFGIMTKRPREGWMILWVMTFLFAMGIVTCHWAEACGTPSINHLCAGNPVRQAFCIGNMEGKETRFGIGASVLTAVVTSDGATGSYNSMHDSYTPLGGMVPLVNMLIGEAVYGGLGTGLYSMVFWILITVFVSGLMVGRTPEFMGNKLGPHEIKLVMLYLLASPIAVLLLTTLAVGTGDGLAGLVTNSGPHGFSEILFAYTSANANNGQNFAGLNANSFFYNTTTAVAMMVGRFALAIPALILAGRFAQQPIRQPTSGTLKTDTVTFGALVVATILVVGGLSYLPALSLGPIVEHLLMMAQRW